MPTVKIGFVLLLSIIDRNNDWSDMRFIEELLHPEKKCERVGHKLLTTKSFWIAKCWKANELLSNTFYYLNAVAIKLRKMEIYCSRCGHVEATAWEEVSTIQSLTLNSNSQTEWEETGLISYD